MNKRPRAAKWLGINAFMAAMMWLAFAQGSGGAANVVRFFVWLQLAVGLCCLSTELVREFQKTGAPSVPLWLAACYPTVFTLVLVWHGWHWSAAAYAIACVLQLRIYMPAAQAPAGADAGQ